MFLDRGITNNSHAFSLRSSFLDNFQFLAFVQPSGSQFQGNTKHSDDCSQITFQSTFKSLTSVKAQLPDESVTRPFLLEKSIYIAEKLKVRNVLGYLEPVFLDLNWIDRWKKRHNITSRQISSESQSADHAGADNWISTQLKLIREEFEDKDIFNADETGLFWKMTPDRTLSFRGDLCKGGKRSKERLTVLAAASVLGERFPLLVIRKCKRPYCFRGVLNLPVEYDANRTAWMTSEIFEKWLRKLNNSMRFDDRKIAMILDNFSGHPNLNLSHIKLFFLPPNTTSMAQPMDAGIIKNLKHHYRGFLVRKRLLAIDSETGFKLDLLQALDWLKMSWDDVTPTTIKHYYQHVGFKDLPATEETSAPDTSIWSSAEEAGLVSDGLSFEDFVVLDDGVAIGPGANGLEIDDILNSLHPPSDNDVDIKNDDNEYPLNIHVPSFDTVVSCLDTVMKFLRTLPCSEKQIQSVSELQNFLTESQLSRLQQASITSFFKSN
ncbi:Tigger transposable element-derived protein 6-like [Oopsacas minuta]|uniref:Tigger transposable element-derived protein 6-like n=1 Tax=Oopsacas minuta TaxID=111878 RepID=A0AAV7KJ90_9METZ|nr:Tigger transposable element-derived protein 6-like [Oopsacas minuta]